jgi:hypothetical protein
LVTCTNHRLARLERRLDALGLALEAADVEVHLAGVEHRVAALADVHEGGLHRRQHVLDLAQVDVADVGLVAGPVHVVLDQHAVLEHCDLGPVVALADHHGPLDRLAAGEELRLGDDRRTAATGLPALAAPLLLGLEPGGTLDRADVVVPVRLAHVHHGVRRVVRPGSVGTVPGRTPAALAPPPPAAAPGFAVGVGRSGVAIVAIVGRSLGRGRVRLGVRPVPACAALGGPAAAAAGGRPPALALAAVGAAA